MKLTFIPNIHPKEDVFENYSFDRLADQEAADFEEHLLICERCQSTLVEMDEYILLMKVATLSRVSERDGGLLRGTRQRGLRWNFAAAAVLFFTCLTALLSWRAPSGEPKPVELDAFRGAVSHAPAGQPLDLRIDLKDVRPAAGYRVEVVDETGRRLWFGGTPARLTRGLSPGIYWVRLSTDTGEALREFGLSVGQWK